MGFDNHMTFNRHVFETLFVRWRHRVAPGEGFCVNMGWARADDPVYSTELIVAGMRIFAGPEEGTRLNMTRKQKGTIIQRRMKSESSGDRDCRCYSLL
jgi:hypothetical protein